VPAASALTLLVPSEPRASATGHGGLRVAVTCLAAAALILMWVQEPSTARPATSNGNLWRDARLLVMLGIGTGFAFAWNLSVTALPLTVAARGLDPAETGWPLAIAAVVTIVGQRSLWGAGVLPDDGRACRRRGIRRRRVSLT
jgi:hypothetical protein